MTFQLDATAASGHLCVHDEGANALSDPDNPPITDEEMATGFRPADLRTLRERLRLSQGDFAEAYGLSVRTLEEWEQGRRVPDNIARTYLRVIEQEPEMVARAVARATAAPKEE